MNKFAYWGGVRSGKMQVWQLFEINGKKTAVLPQSGKKWPAYAIIYGKEYMQIYHEVNGKIKTKICKPTVFENGVYKNNFQTNGVDRYKDWSRDPQVLYQCFNKVFEQDLIICPYLLFGYHGSKYGKMGNKEYNVMIKNRKPDMIVDLDYSIKMLKKRRNIIPYKSNKSHETYIFTMCHPDPLVCLERQKHSVELIDLTKELLTEYDIPYEMFDLDNPDYSIFGFDKSIPKELFDQN